MIYNSAGKRVPRRKVIVDKDVPPCGVLVNLTKIQALFDPYAYFDHGESSSASSDLGDASVTHVDAYPLAFLRSAGNIQADGIPACFYPVLAKINRSVRKRNPLARGSGDEDEDEVRSVDGNESGNVSSLQAVKGVSAQFYNYIMHRVATRAGRHDAQQGTVTAAISGAFASSQKHKAIASKKQLYCRTGLPSDRFHEKISLEDCPTSCRAEFVYSVDVRALKNASGTHVSFPRSPFSFPFLTFIIQFDIQ